MRIPGHSTPTITTQLTDRKSAPDKAVATSDPAEGRSIESTSSRAAAAGVKLGESITSHLQEVRRQIAEGSYPIDFDRLAEKILEDETARAVGGAS
jgi:anti-sigma28 factor (negative regulator of flagellin synthesis)